MKRLLAICLALLLVLSFSVTAFAADDGSVTIKNATPGEKYNIYKVFDLTYTGNGQTTEEGSTTTTDSYEGVAYTYTKTGETVALYTALVSDASPFTLTETSAANVYSVSLKQGKGASDVSTFLNANKALLPSAGEEKTAPAAAEGETTSTVSWTDLPYGYYFITSSVGATVTIDSTLKDVVVEDKNSIPSQDKKQATGDAAPEAATGYVDDQQDVGVGDTIWYQIEVKDGKGTDKQLMITDTLSTGLTLNQDSIMVYKGSTVVQATEGEGESAVTNYTISDKSDSGFKVTFTPEYVSSLQEDDLVYIRFSAVVNDEAVTVDKVNNTSHLDYSEQHTDDSVEAVTYKFQLDKIESESKYYADLMGARFELYRGSVADANKVWFVKGTAVNGVPVLNVVGVGESAPADVTGAFCDIRLTDSSVDTDTNSLNSSKVIFVGLDKTSYVLHETEAPKGYNLAENQTVPESTLVVKTGTITDAVGIANDEAVVSVINQSGSELPSTGGIGTTIFYVVGGMMVAAAGVLLITKKRMSKEG